MPDILHRVAIKSTLDDTYKALATREGLAGWWTTDVQGSTAVGGVINFRFADRGYIDMKVLEATPGKRVLWEVVDGPQSWIGTKVGFDLKSDEGATVVLFKHAGWREPSEMMHHCTTKWGTVLMSAKASVETGKGAPFPNDVHIANKGD